MWPSQESLRTLFLPVFQLPLDFGLAKSSVLSVANWNPLIQLIGSKLQQRLLEKQASLDLDWTTLLNLGKTEEASIFLNADWSVAIFTSEYHPQSDLSVDPEDFTPLALPGIKRAEGFAPSGFPSGPPENQHSSHSSAQLRHFNRFTPLASWFSVARFRRARPLGRGVQHWEGGAPAQTGCR